MQRPPFRSDDPPPRTRGVRHAPPALSRFSSAVVQGLAAKTRFVDPDIVANWPALAGAELARLCRPGRLTGGAGGRTLEVVVAHGAAAATVEFGSETLRRRLNDYFGPNAIARIAVVLGPGPRPPSGGLSRFRAG